MSTKNGSSRTMSMADDLVIPQYRLSKILFMYAWPLAWFAFLIYVIAPLFLRPDGTLPLWGNNLVNFLGHGAELIVAHALSVLEVSDCGVRGLDAALKRVDLTHFLCVVECVTLLGRGEL